MQKEQGTLAEKLLKEPPLFVSPYLFIHIKNQQGKTLRRCSLFPAID